METMAQQIVQQPILDVSDLMSRIGHDEELACELMVLYLQDMPALIAELQYAVECRNAEQIALKAHSIKGASANMGASQVRQWAYSLEMCGKEGRLDPCDHLLFELHRSFMVFSAYCQCAQFQSVFPQPVSVEELKAVSNKLFSIQNTEELASSNSLPA